MSSDLAFYVQFQVKPERLEEWKDAVMEVIDRMSAESTFVSCYMHQDIQRLRLVGLRCGGILRSIVSD